ncbi:MAG: hypothetical protein RMJ65_06395, partial [candidate division WOR-3 bacterium]|nr:hypothetical protein [candidate division WOR-3 bacterium]
YELKICIRIYPHDNNTEGFFIENIKNVTNDMDLLSHINKKRTVKTSIKNINNLLSELANKYDFLSKILQQYAVECKNQILYIMTNEAKEFEALKIIYRGFPWAKLVRNKIFITDNSLAILRNLSFNGENV